MRSRPSSPGSTGRSRRRSPGTAPTRSVSRPCSGRSRGGRASSTYRNEAEARRIVADLDGAGYVVEKVTKKERRSRPAPPFITSTLQQEAARKLRFTARRTMQVAQQLYEGVNLGDQGATGLITYMRTDSTNVSSLALNETGQYVKEKFGAGYAPPSPRRYLRKVKGAQEAHEAIRPTSVYAEPSKVKQYLNREQARLYDLIWKRMVASQMSDALFDSTTIDIEAKSAKTDSRYAFRAEGSVLKFPRLQTAVHGGRGRRARGRRQGRPGAARRRGERAARVPRHQAGSALYPAAAAI